MGLRPVHLTRGHQMRLRLLHLYFRALLELYTIKLESAAINALLDLCDPIVQLLGLLFYGVLLLDTETLGLEVLVE